MDGVTNIMRHLLPLFFHDFQKLQQNRCNLFVYIKSDYFSIYRYIQPNVMPFLDASASL